MTVRNAPSSVREAVRATPAYPFTPIDTPVKLDQNESPWDFPEHLKQLAMERALAKPWNRYPDLNADTLKERIGQLENWDPRGVVVTPGSNVIIKLLTEMSGINQTVLTVKPTFAVYELEAMMLGATLTEIPLNDDYSLPVEGLLHELQGGPGVFYITQPHAPTGHLDTRADVERLVKAAGERWTTVIDEAYHQYSRSDYRDLVRQHDHTLSVRTFSKAWGLAGLRLGYALTNPELATELQKLVPAFNVNTLTQAVIEVALEHPEYVRERVEATIAERDRMTGELEAHPNWQVLSSTTNFFLVRTPDATEAYRALIERGVLVRRQDSAFMLGGCLRIAVGTPEENDRFLEAAMQIQAN